MGKFWQLACAASIRQATSIDQIRTLFFLSDHRRCKAVVQLCIVHVVRRSLNYVS